MVLSLSQGNAKVGHVLNDGRRYQSSCFGASLKGGRRTFAAIPFNHHYFYHSQLSLATMTKMIYGIAYFLSP